MNLTSSFLLSKTTFDFLTGQTLDEKYTNLYNFPQIVQFERKFFGPFDKPSFPWDISDEEKIILANKDVNRLRLWIVNNIIIKFGTLDYKTLDVLVRIATGMLNKCDIDDNIKRKFHQNLVWNLRAEHNDLVLSGLPF